MASLSPLVLDGFMRGLQRLYRIMATSDSTEPFT